MKSADEVKAYILAFVASAVTVGSLPGGLPDDFDLRRDGAIDSLGFLRLLAELEATTGRPIDLSEVDPAQLTNLCVLARHVAGQIV